LVGGAVTVEIAAVSSIGFAVAIEIAVHSLVLAASALGFVVSEPRRDLVARALEETAILAVSSLVPPSVSARVIAVISHLFVSSLHEVAAEDESPGLSQKKNEWADFDVPHLVVEIRPFSAGRAALAVSDCKGRKAPLSDRLSKPREAGISCQAGGAGL
jgi:hypothetical protein